VPVSYGSGMAGGGDPPRRVRPLGQTAGSPVWERDPTAGGGVRLYCRAGAFLVMEGEGRGCESMARTPDLVGTTWGRVCRKKRGRKSTKRPASRRPASLLPSCWGHSARTPSPRWGRPTSWTGAPFSHHREGGVAKDPISPKQGTMQGMRYSSTAE